MPLTYPQVGDTWRHYKGSDYVILALPIDDGGRRQVAYRYTPEYLPLGIDVSECYVQDLSRFMGSNEAHKPRFIRVRGAA